MERAKLGGSEARGARESPMTMVPHDDVLQPLIALLSLIYIHLREAQRWNLPREDDRISRGQAHTSEYGLAYETTQSLSIHHVTPRRQYELSTRHAQEVQTRLSCHLRA